MQSIKQNKWRHRARKVIPVEILKKPENNRVMVEMPKPFPTDFRPISSLSIKTIKSKLNQYDPCYVQPHQINGHREVTQKQIELRSQNFCYSKFTIDIPFNFISRESAKTFFTLQMDGEKVLMQTLDGILTCDEWIEDKNGVSLTFKQMMKFQQIMNDTRKRNKPTEEDIQRMYDEDGQQRDVD